MEAVRLFLMFAGDRRTPRTLPEALALDYLYPGICLSGFSLQRRFANGRWQECIQRPQRMPPLRKNPNCAPHQQDVIDYE
jgi:hypothetical protein